MKPALRKTTTCLPRWNNHPHHYLPSEWGNWSGPRTMLWTKDFAMTISWTLVTLFSLVDQNCQLCMALKIFGYLLLFICFCHSFFAKFLLFIFFPQSSGLYLPWENCNVHTRSALLFQLSGHLRYEPCVRCESLCLPRLNLFLFDNSSLFSAMDIIVLWWQYGLHQSCQ